MGNKDKANKEREKLKKQADLDKWTNVIDVNLQYRYRYKPNGTGELFIGDEIRPIFVIKECTPPMFENILHINHPNHLRCIFENQKDRHLICEPVGCTLREYIGSLSMDPLCCPVKQFTILVDPLVQVENGDEYEQMYIDQNMRRLIRQMLIFVHDIHKLGYSLNKFDIDDLRMDQYKGTTIKFCGIEFQKTPTLESCKLDFLHIMEVCEKLVEDISSIDTFCDLKQLCEDLRTLDDGKQLTCHLSIMPVDSVFNFLISCDEKLSDATILDKMKSCDNWASKFIDDPKLSAVKMSYTFKNANGYQADYKPNSSDPYEIKCSLLRFIRNFVVHFKESLLGMFNDEEAEAIVMRLFRKEIFDIHSILFENGTLDDFTIRV